MATKRSAKTIIDNEQGEPKTQSKPNNHLKLRIDDLKTFDPLTANQKLFFDAYKRGDYFVALHGVAGTGKTFIALYKAIEEVLVKCVVSVKQTVSAIMFTTGEGSTKVVFEIVVSQ